MFLFVSVRQWKVVMLMSFAVVPVIKTFKKTKNDLPPQQFQALTFTLSELFSFSLLVGVK